MWSTDLTENGYYEISLKSVQYEPNCTRRTGMTSLCAFVMRKAPTASPLKIGPIGCAETSVNNYQPRLSNNPEERRPFLCVFVNNV